MILHLSNTLCRIKTLLKQSSLGEAAEDKLSELRAGWRGSASIAERVGTWRQRDKNDYLFDNSHLKCWRHLEMTRQYKM